MLTLMFMRSWLATINTTDTLREKAKGATFVEYLLLAGAAIVAVAVIRALLQGSAGSVSGKVSSGT